MSHRGLLLLNLGTPEDSDPQSVGRYLNEFLMDPNVIDIPTIARWPLVNILITPKRKYASAEAYQSIWTDEGSPLLVNSLKLTEDLKSKIHEAKVELAMRYGNPSVRSALIRLRDNGVQELSVFPLYPHYAMSSTLTALQKVKTELKSLGWDPKLRHYPSFYNNPEYIGVMANNCEKLLSDGFEPDYYLMSYHGLPKRHLKRLNKGCEAGECCDVSSERSATCYRYQAYQTSKLLASQLGLSSDQYKTTFQSRLGGGWIEPFTDVVLEELGKKGIKKLAVFSPSFASDCLETLEEIQIRGSEIFQEAGGEELRLVPSLNNEPQWTNAIMDIYHQEKGWVSGL